MFFYDKMYYDVIDSIVSDDWPFEKTIQYRRASVNYNGGHFAAARARLRCFRNDNIPSSMSIIDL